MKEVHNSTFTTYPGSTKMHNGMKTHFWWLGTKRDVVDFVARCLTCQRVKTEHQKPSDLLQSVSIPIWKWEHVTMDFMTGAPVSYTHLTLPTKRIV